MPNVRTRRSSLIALAVLAIALGGLAPPGARAATVWRSNLYRSAGYLTQDPYYTMCTAASAMMMLNFIAIVGTGGDGFRWTPTRVKNSPTNYRDLTSLYWFERAHDTLAPRTPGSDAHGWRNALNYFGWGATAMTDPAKRIYDDQAYGTFDGAVRAAVLAIARYHKPVGILGWAGQHAQVITGFVVTGDDPAISTNFTVNGIYLSDPLRSDAMSNRLIWIASFRSGSRRYRFQPYRMIDSPFDDPYTPGWRRSSVASTTSEWYHRWVIVAPIRDGVPADEPPPSPTPPTPTPTPDATPTPTPDATAPDATASPDPTATPTPTPDATPTPTATSTSTPTPDPTATPTPDSTPVVTPTPSSSPTGP